MASRNSNDTLRLSLWAAVGLAVLSILCAYVLLPLAAMGSNIAAGVASAARPVFDALAVLFAGVSLSLWVWLRRRSAPPAGLPEAPVRQVAVSTPAKAPDSVYPVLTTSVDTSAAFCAAPPQQDWTAAVLRQMDWRRFADLCVAYYRETGKFCTVTPLAGSKGIDIRLFDTLGGPVTGISRCWGWGVHRVPSSQLAELRAIMLREKIAQGAWLTNARFGDEIVRFGEENRIAALDCRRFLALLLKLPPESRRHLFEMATEGDWDTPTCPLCEAKMGRRQIAAEDYWACLKFPSCNSTLKARGR